MIYSSKTIPFFAYIELDYITMVYFFSYQYLEGARVKLCEGWQGVKKIARLTLPIEKYKVATKCYYRKIHLYLGELGRG